MPGTEPPGKRLAVHARKLALEPGLQILQRHRRPLLRRMEQTHRPALADHVDRYPRLGLPVVISESWYHLDVLHRQSQNQNETCLSRTLARKSHNHRARELVASRPIAAVQLLHLLCCFSLAAMQTIDFRCQRFQPSAVQHTCCDEVTGTMAHSFVQAFEDELEGLRRLRNSIRARSCSSTPTTPCKGCATRSGLRAGSARSAV